MNQADLNKKIMGDKGSKEKGKVNDPLSSYLADASEKVEFLSTNVITLNLLFSGKVDGGIPMGRISMIAAPPKLGKTFVGISSLKNHQAAGKPIIVIDTERRFPYPLAEKMGLDIRQEALPVFQENSIERIKNIILKVVDDIPRDERKDVLFLVDSWGSLITSKSIVDGLKGADVKDMTDSQKKNDLAKVILNTRATYMVVNHVYDNTAGFGDPLKIPGARKIAFHSDNIVMGYARSRDKDDDEISGYIIKAKCCKSSYAQEDMVLEYRIKKDGGLDIFYGILPDALEGGFVEKTKLNKKNAYVGVGVKGAEPKVEKDIYNAKFWLPIFQQTDFQAYLEDKYTLKSNLDIAEDQGSLGQLKLPPEQQKKTPKGKKEPKE